MAKRVSASSKSMKAGKEEKTIRRKKFQKSKPKIGKAKTASGTAATGGSKASGINKKFKRKRNKKKETRSLAKDSKGVKRSRGDVTSEDNPKAKKTKRASKDTTNSKNATNKKSKKTIMRRDRTTNDKMKETIKEAKNMWEKLRRHDLEKNDRAVLLAELVVIIKDNLFELVKKHDTARIIQCLLKVGAEDARTAVFEALKEHVVELSKLKYAKFVVKALFKYCSSTQRASLIALLYNNVVRLMKHTEASEIVELAYNDYANASQRAMLAQEFYGPHFALFKDTRECSLKEVLDKNPTEKTKLINYMKETVMQLMKKSVVKHSIIHRVLLELLTHADQQSISDIIEGVREVAVEMLHTREGAKVALNCFWHGNAKDRKVLLKSFKGFVTKICKEEHGHLVMMGVFDCVDDTVLVNKTILSEIISSLKELCLNHYGRRVILYLLSPRSPKHFTKQFVQLLTPGDNNAHSKKPRNTRWEELCNAISPPLIEVAAENAIQWACHNSTAPLLIQVVVSASGDLSQIYNKLAKCPEISDLINNPCGHWVVKRLIAAEREGQPSSFASVLMAEVSDNVIVSWTKFNRGCFVLSSLLGSDDSRTRVANIIKPLVTDKAIGTVKGRKVLLKLCNETA